VCVCVFCSSSGPHHFVVVGRHRRNDLLAGRFHLVNLAHGVSYVSGRSRVRLVGFSKLRNVVDNASGRVVGALSLGFLLVQDLPDGGSSAFAGPSPIGEFFQAPAGDDAPFRVARLEEFEGFQEVLLGFELVGLSEPAVGNFVVRVIRQMKDWSDHDDLVKRHGHLVGRSLRVVGSDRNDFVKGNRFALLWFWFCFLLLFLLLLLLFLL